MAAAADILIDIDQFFDGPSGPPKFDLTHVHHGRKDFVLHTDFSLTRPSLPLVSPNSTFVNGVATKDVTIDEEKNVRARIFLPEIADTCRAKLPLLVYFHGGGFVCLSVDCRLIHDFCEDICKNVEAVVVSIEYRLAPEYRLPSQYEDARISLEWLRSHARAFKVHNDAAVVEFESAPDTRLVSQDLERADRPEVESNFDEVDRESTSDSWLTSHADFDRVFLAGDSAGGNIVHNLLIDCSPEIFSPLQLSGLILIQPAFGGLSRTPAELGVTQDYKLCSLDFFWKLALPRESDRSHPYCDVLAKLNELLETQQLSFPDTLLIVGGRDMLRDWQLSYYEALKRTDTKVKLVKYEDALHGFYAFRHHEQTEIILREIAQFVRDRGAISEEMVTFPAPMIEVEGSSLAASEGSITSMISISRESSIEDVRS